MRISWQIGGNRVFELRSFDAIVALEKGGKGLGSGSLEAELGSMDLLMVGKDTLPMLVKNFLWQAIEPSITFILESVSSNSVEHVPQAGLTSFP